MGAIHAARDRDVHVEPIPLLGGLAMYGGLAAGLLVASQVDAAAQDVFVGTGWQRAAAGRRPDRGVGFVDDRWGMGAVSKLAGQVAAGVILVWSGAAAGLAAAARRRHAGPDRRTSRPR